ncbi:MAG: ribbon-helix-helix domain-containing protein [Candidatus Hodarchaeales archaeon]
MKVIAFKIYGRQKALIQSLVQKGYYPSFSEAVRTACWDLLGDLLQENKSKTTETNAEQLPDIIRKNKKLTAIESSLTSKKVATSAKFPIKVLKKIDDYVLHETFKNRSEFIRFACSSFLMTDSEIFANFMEDNSPVK